MDSEFINEKIKQLNKEWVEQTHIVENTIKQELINEWSKKNGIYSGDDVLIIDFHNYNKLNKTIYYYRKAKLIGFNINISLNSRYDSIFFIKPIIKLYNADNKTLQKKTHLYKKIFKMDLNLLNKTKKFHYD
jgi:hypothetical protein